MADIFPFPVWTQCPRWGGWFNGVSPTPPEGNPRPLLADLPRLSAKGRVQADEGLTVSFCLSGGLTGF